MRLPFPLIAIFMALALCACNDDDPQPRRPDTTTEEAGEEEPGDDSDPSNPWGPSDEGEGEDEGDAGEGGEGSGEGGEGDSSGTGSGSGASEEHPYPETLYIVDYNVPAWTATAALMERLDADAGLYAGHYVVVPNSGLRLMENTEYTCYWNLGGGSRPGTLRRSASAPAIAVDGTGPRYFVASLSEMTVRTEVPVSLTLHGDAIKGETVEARAMDEEGLSWKATVTFVDGGTWTLTVNGDDVLTLGGSYEELRFGGAPLPSPGAGKRRVYISLGGYPTALQVES